MLRYDLNEPKFLASKFGSIRKTVFATNGNSFEPIKVLLNRGIQLIKGVSDASVEIIDHHDGLFK